LRKPLKDLPLKGTLIKYIMTDSACKFKKGTKRGKFGRNAMESQRHAAFGYKKPGLQSAVPVDGKSD
jgi:hypothetical protein